MRTVMGAAIRNPAVAVAVLIAVAYSYFYQAGGWNQNVRFDLIRSPGGAPDDPHRYVPLEHRRQELSR